MQEKNDTSSPVVDGHETILNEETRGVNNNVNESKTKQAMKKFILKTLSDTDNEDIINEVSLQ